MHFKYKSLTPTVTNILLNKGTEAPFSGKYYNEIIDGSYICRGCGAVLFRSNTQFTSGCGWPSFDDEIPNKITRVQDADGRRTEILCSTCQGHLGHVFTGEQFTHKNQRHCVNSLAIEFVHDLLVSKTDEAIIAGGCFWGIQHAFDQFEGVLLTEVGYTDGEISNPTYQQVCAHNTGHVEAVRIVFDADKINFKEIISYFFTIHDPTQANGQGPDIGSQYLSRIFYYTEIQEKIANDVLRGLDVNNKVVTQIKPVAIFWPAEEYHQHYFSKNNMMPHCG